MDPVLLILYAHTFDSELNDVDGGEREVSAADGCLRSEAVLEHAGTASHCRHFPLISLRVVSLPEFVMVERSVEIHEVREETACRDLAGELVKIVVAVFREVAHASLLLPYLDWEDGCGTVAHTFVCGVEELADDAAALGRSVCSVIDGAEYHLVSATRMDRVHIVYECLHRLMHAAYGHIHCVLDHPVITLDSYKVALEVVIDRGIVKTGVAFAVDLTYLVQLLLESLSHERSHIEVESRYGLTSVHLVLYGLHRDTAQDTCSLDTLCRA